MTRHKPTRLRPAEGGRFHQPVGPAPEVVAAIRAHDDCLTRWNRAPFIDIGDIISWPGGWGPIVDIDPAARAYRCRDGKGLLNEVTERYATLVRKAEKAPGARVDLSGVFVTEHQRKLLDDTINVVDEELERERTRLLGKRVAFDDGEAWPIRVQSIEREVSYDRSEIVARAEGDGVGYRAVSRWLTVLPDEPAKGFV